MEQIPIGSAIKTFRINAGYSQNEFAKLCKMANSTLSDIENNKQYPHNKNLINICNILKIDIAWLILETLSTEKIPIIFKSKFRHHLNGLLSVLKDSVNPDIIPETKTTKIQHNEKY